MKKYIYAVVSLWGLLYGCSNGDDNTNIGEEPQDVSVSLVFKGEILVDDTPMSRAEESTNDLYGIQIYKDGEYYQYGLFDDISNIQTLLQTGSKYKFVCTLVKNGKNVLYSRQDEYSYPFVRDYGSAANDDMPITNCFEKSYYNDQYFAQLDFGSSSSDDPINRSNKYAIADRYYGEYDNYIPREGGTVNIELKHTVFGIKTIVRGIPDGSVSITIKNNIKTFFSKSDITSDFQDGGVIYECGDIYDAWQYADNYTENVTVSGIWTRGVGVEQDLGSKEIQIKRNVMNVIRITLSADDGDANIGITTDTDDDMSNEEVNVDLN